MTRLTWTERKHHSGVDRGVVYSRSGLAEVWNGLISVTETPSDIRERVRYRDGIRIVNHRSEDSFSASIECFTYPDSISNSRMPFDMAYRTKTDKGYEIHLLYNASAQIGGATYSQSDTSPISVSVWTKPNAMPAHHTPSAHIIIDTSLASPVAVSALEDILHGEEYANPRMPLAEELLDVFDINALFNVVDNGDGTVTIQAPDDVFTWFEGGLFEVQWPTPAVVVNEETYVLRNW